MKVPFLYRFRSELPAIEAIDASEIAFDAALGLNRLEGGEIAWSSRSSRYPTSCHTAGRTVKAGYTRSGKWKPSKYVPSKTDRRAGK